MDWYSSFNYMFPYTMNFSSGLGQYPMYSSGMNYMNYQQPMFSFGSAYSSQNSMMNNSDYWDSWVKSMLNNSNSNYSWQQPMNYSWQQPMNYDTYWANQAKSSNDSNTIYWKDNTATEKADKSKQESTKGDATTKASKVSGSDNTPKMLAVDSKEALVEYKKLPWYKKALRAGTNMLQGVWNLATKFVGFDENGKWSFKKCLGNLALAGVAVAATAIPVVGPVIGATLLASGVVGGTVAVVKGARKANKAETLQELDNAWQQIGAGGFIGITSACGIRGLGKSARLAGAGENFSVATQRTTTTGKAWQSISQWCKDATVNAFKGTTSKVRTNYKAFKESDKGFFNTWWQNLKSAFPKVGEEKFKESQEQVLKKLNNRRLDLNRKATLTDAEKSELKFIDNAISKVVNCKTKKQWLELKNKNNDSSIQALFKDLEKHINNEAQHLNEYSACSKNCKAYKKDIIKLSKTRIKTMRTNALTPKTHKDDLNRYLGKDSHAERNLFQYVKETTAGTCYYRWTSPIKQLWVASNLIYKPWAMISKKPVSGIYKVKECVSPTLERNIFIAMAGDSCGAVNTKEEIAKMQEEALQVEGIGNLYEYNKQLDLEMAQVRNMQAELEDIQEVQVKELERLKKEEPSEKQKIDILQLDLAKTESQIRAAQNYEDQLMEEQILVRKSMEQGLNLQG